MPTNKELEDEAMTGSKLDLHNGRLEAWPVQARGAPNPSAERRATIFETLFGDRPIYTGVRMLKGARMQFLLLIAIFHNARRSSNAGIYELQVQAVRTHSIECSCVRTSENHVWQWSLEIAIARVG